MRPHQGKLALVGKLNIERFHNAKPAQAGEAQRRVKAASLSFARLSTVFDEPLRR
jgi:hypothetical protein